MMENREEEEEGDKIIRFIGNQSPKPFLPIYLSRIRKHYASSAPPPPALPSPPVHISKLKPRDLRRKWKKATYKKKENPLKATIRGLAPSVVSVSYFYGVQRKVDCSGIIIDWNDSKGIATVLTSAKLMTSPFPRDYYYFIVRLPNGKLLLAEEDYVDYYHNIATFKVNSDAKLTPLDLYSPPLENLQGVEVVALARAFHTCQLSQSCGLIRKDYPYFGCEQLVSTTCRSTPGAEGGPLITKAGQIIGINFYDGDGYVHPLPTSVINLCLRNWNSHGIVMRPWLGFTMIDIANLPPDTFERMHKFSGDSGVVVKEVYKGSPADKVGVQSGDSINAVNGIKLCCVQEYAELLNDVSYKLSASHPNQTDTTVSVSVNDKLVRAENLSVNDKNFCSCWRWGGDESDELTFVNEPLSGSQTDPICDEYSVC